MSLKETVQTLQKKLGLDAHHATERFGIIVTAFAASLVILLAGTAGSAVSNTAAKMSETALYTPTFKTSKTGLSGNVAGVYVSPEKTRALVLMQFAKGASASISANARNYQGFLTGSDGLLTGSTASVGQQPLKSSVSGQFVVFGTSGFVGAVLDSDTPFPQQILNLTVRANSELVYQPEQTVELRKDLQGDASFTKHDQWRLFVNPGAGGATVSDALPESGEAFSPSDIYYDLVLAEQEKDARKTLEEDLARMQVDLAKIDEFTAQMATTQVDGVRIIAPGIPKQIKGDKVTGVRGDADDPLTLKTSWTSRSGWDFDWRGGDIRSGYLKDIVPADTSYVTFLEKRARTLSAGSAEGKSEAFSPDKLVWKLSDGTDLVTDYANANETMRPLLDVMTNLTTAYGTYYEDKTRYQGKDHEVLINLEVSMKNVDSGSTLNRAENALLTY